MGAVAMLLRNRPEEEMERLQVKQAREIIYRPRQAQSERRVAEYLRTTRVTVRKYHVLALREGCPHGEEEPPSDRELLDRLEPTVPPARL
ncbi:MAG: hypothetical protein M1274_03505 [Actinobacteria bacterium]|nr:hypothetical protein [Actinomycetota bacterium]